MRKILPPSYDRSVRKWVKHAKTVVHPPPRCIYLDEHLDRCMHIYLDAHASTQLDQFRVRVGNGGDDERLHRNPIFSRQHLKPPMLLGW